LLAALLAHADRQRRFKRKMPRIEFSESSIIDATPKTLYDIIADYHDGHKQILPPKYFRNLAVHEGGRGAGTKITFEMTVGGKTRTARATITEPEPGRVLIETYDDGIVTKFIVDPIDDSKRARVTFHTTWTKPGIAGYIERLLVPGLLRPIYIEEQKRLADVAKKVSNSR